MLKPIIILVAIGAIGLVGYKVGYCQVCIHSKEFSEKRHSLFLLYDQLLQLIYLHH